MASQLAQPNLEIIEKAGMCLQFARRVFGAPAVEATAHDAIGRLKYLHRDRNFPAGVAVPVWFEWWGLLPGDRQKYQYDHAAVRMPDGKIWSSPLTGTGRAWFATVDDLTRAFGGGMKYIGWSEDISGVKVIETEEYMKRNPTVDEVKHAFMYGLAADPTKKQVDDYSNAPDGQGWLAMFNDIMRIKHEQLRAAESDRANADFVPIQETLYKKK